MTEVYKARQINGYSINLEPSDSGYRVTVFLMQPTRFAGYPLKDMRFGALGKAKRNFYKLCGIAKNERRV